MIEKYYRFKLIVTLIVALAMIGCAQESGQTAFVPGAQESRDDLLAIAATLDFGKDTGNGVKSIAVGFAHACALTKFGEVICWGNNHFGQLGYGHTNNIGDNESPVSQGFVKVGGVATEIVAGSSYTCALLKTGDVRCWGANSVGQLGLSNTDMVGDDEVPSSRPAIQLGSTRTLKISGGGTHVCALKEGGSVFCWGWNKFGQLGYGHTNDIGDNEHPLAAGPVFTNGAVDDISAGMNHSCIRRTPFWDVLCWGNNNVGQLGQANTNLIGDNELPGGLAPIQVGGSVRQLEAKLDHTCAVLKNGNLRCWGHNLNGELGYGHTNHIGDNETPASAGDVPILFTGETLSWISKDSPYGYATCALIDRTILRCWGANGFGALGYGHTQWIGDDEFARDGGTVPHGVNALPAMVSSGFNNLCVLFENSKVKCAGDDADGGMGDGLGDDDIGDDEPLSAINAFFADLGI